MTNMMDRLFGPIDVEYCNYFYISSIAMFTFFCFIALNLILSTFKTKKLDITLFVLMFQSFLLYFVNRLFYSMCLGGLK